MKKYVSLFLCFWILSALTSCDVPLRSDPGASGQDVSLQYQTISVLLTKTALAASVLTSASPTQPTLTSVVTETPLPTASSTSPTGTPQVTLTEQPGAHLSQPMVTPCDLAQPGRPIDVSIPDDSRFRPGENFSKTWRLINAGSCTWTREYAVVWFSGDGLNANREQIFTGEVPPGKSVDLTVDMIAPETPGVYQSNWKLRNHQGELFGIGSNGGAPFWVRIEVIPVDTPTPEASEVPNLPTATSTPVVLVSGTAGLTLGDSIDLDSGKLNQTTGNDLAFQRSADDKLFLAPLEGVQVAVFGVAEPGLQDCLLTPTSNVALPLDQHQPGTYLCYRSEKGLPGRLLIISQDTSTNRLEVEYRTWIVP